MKFLPPPTAAFAVRITLFASRGLSPAAQTVNAADKEERGFTIACQPSSVACRAVVKVGVGFVTDSQLVRNNSLLAPETFCGIISDIEGASATAITSIVI